MTTTRHAPTILSVATTFSEHRYRIPLYQRAYAWTDSEIHTLLADVRDARITSEKGGAREYYIGSLVLDATQATDEGAPEESVMEVVDGQQRLTTLFVILSVAPRILGGPTDFAGRLTFEGRSDAARDLRLLAQDGADALPLLRTSGIRHAAELVKSACEKGSGGESSPQDLTFSREDLDHLRHRVKILRTVLPPGTDLNHYFEVMNTRGEQLEKHEILKAQLSSKLGSESDRAVFARIWDACAVMNRHIQTQFSTSSEGGSERSRIFGGDWNQFQPRDEDELFWILTRGKAVDDSPSTTVTSKENQPLLLSAILTDDAVEGAHGFDDSEEEVGAYGPIIDFPNLLLHVLKIQRDETFRWGEANRSAEEVRLEDKYLIAEFQRTAPSTAEARHSWVREFAYLLLKTRFLMDTYVIRTQTTPAGDDDENWVLHRAFRYQRRGTEKQQLSARSTFASGQGDTRVSGTDEEPLDKQVRLLQSMFQVTDTRRASKYFLFQILSWLHKQSDVDAADPPPKQRTPAEVEGAKLVAHLEEMARERLSTIDPTAIDTGTQVPNFVFNVLDYALWKMGTGRQGGLHQLRSETATELERVAAGFRFQYRTSVEHFDPRNPSVEQGHKQLDKDQVDRFGNLCIMTRAENSRRGNLAPLAKANQFKSVDQSLKFQLMAEFALRKQEWGEPQIQKHQEEMLRVLNSLLPGWLNQPVPAGMDPAEDNEGQAPADQRGY